MEIPTCAVFPSGLIETTFMGLQQSFIVSGSIPWDHCDFVGVSSYYFGNMYLLGHLQDDVLVVFVVCSSHLVPPTGLVMIAY